VLWTTFCSNLCTWLVQLSGDSRQSPAYHSDVFTFVRRYAVASHCFHYSKTYNVVLQLLHVDCSLVLHCCQICLKPREDSSCTMWCSNRDGATDADHVVSCVLEIRHISLFVPGISLSICLTQKWSKSAEHVAVNVSVQVFVRAGWFPPFLLPLLPSSLFPFSSPSYPVLQK